MNNKISNSKVEVPKGIELNEKDELTILLSNLKCLEKNMAVTLTEASNEELYKKFYNMFENISQMQRNIYELMFKNGWYSLELAPKTKIQTLEKDLTTTLNDLQN